MAISWSDLTPELQERVAQHLPGNEVACSLRLINKAAAKLFRGAARVRLSEAVSPHVFVWRWGSPAAYRNLTLKSRRQLLALTAASGVLSNLQVAFAAVGCSPDESAFESAAAGSHFSVCAWLAGQNCLGVYEAVETAADNGHVALVRWFLKRWPTANSFAWRGAARAGRRDMCEALIADAGPSCVVPWSAVYGAAKGGHAELVQWLLPKVPVQKLDDVKLLQRAAHGCDLAGLQHVYGNLPSVQQAGWRVPLQGGIRLLLAALTSPTPDWRTKVDWLRAHGCVLNDWTAHASDFVLSDGLQPSDRIERARLYLQLLPKGERAGAIQNILSNALHRAEPELVDFALEQWPHTQLADLASVVSSWGTTATIEGCGRKPVQYRAEYAFKTPAQVVVAARLAAAGVPIWPTVVKAAIQTGSLQMLQWMALEVQLKGASMAALRVAELDGLPRTGPEVTVRAAAWAELWNLLKRSGEDLAMIAAEAGNLEVMTWLRAHGCAWDETALTRAAQGGNIALLEWMVEEGCPLPTMSTCYWFAIINHDMAVLQCLRRLHVPWGPEERQLLKRAVRNGCRVELLAWLLEAGCAVDWEEARGAVAARCGNTAQAVRAFIEQRAPQSGCIIS